MTEANFKNARTIEDMMQVIRDNYVVKNSLGFATKIILINQLKSRLKLSNDDVKYYSTANTIGDLIEMIINTHGDTIVKPENRKALINGLAQIIALTRLQPK